MTAKDFGNDAGRILGSKTTGITQMRLLTELIHSNNYAASTLRYMGRNFYSDSFIQRVIEANRDYISYSLRGCLPDVVDELENCIGCDDLGWDDFCY